jgi:hypothetical protein
VTARVGRAGERGEAGDVVAVADDDRTRGLVPRPDDDAIAPEVRVWFDRAVARTNPASVGVPDRVQVAVHVGELDTRKVLRVDRGKIVERDLMLVERPGELVAHPAVRLEHGREERRERGAAAPGVVHQRAEACRSEPRAAPLRLGHDAPDAGARKAPPSEPSREAELGRVGDRSILDVGAPHVLEPEGVLPRDRVREREVERRRQQASDVVAIAVAGDPDVGRHRAVSVAGSQLHRATAGRRPALGTSVFVARCCRG